MTEPVAPIDWARHYAAQREQQPARKLLDQMSDRELVKLYERAEKAERAANLLADSHRRAEQAGAAIARVRALPSAPQVVVRIHIDGPSEQNGYNRGWSSAISAVRAALDPQEPTP